MHKLGSTPSPTPAESPTTRPQKTSPAKGRRRLAARLSAIALALALVMGGGLVTSQPAQAASAYCGGGRCTVYLNKFETWSLGYAAVPAPPASTPLPLRNAYYALAYGHRWFAKQYANRGMCSGFRLSVYPWESQGYFGYYC